MTQTAFLPFLMEEELRLLFEREKRQKIKGGEKSWFTIVRFHIDYTTNSSQGNAAKLFFNVCYPSLQFSISRCVLKDIDGRTYSFNHILIALGHNTLFFSLFLQGVSHIELGTFDLLVLTPWIGAFEATYSRALL